MIYKDIISILENVLSRFKGVNFVKYQGDDLNNQQQNYKQIQCYIDTYTFHQFILTKNIANMEVQIYILKHPNDQTPQEILDCQDECYNAALNVLAFLDMNEDYKGILKLYDYSIITLDRYTAQANAGVKLSLILAIPNGVNLCTMPDFFNDEPYTPDEDREIDVPEKEISEELNIKKIKLPKKNC